jgi:hypothetical protein
MRNISIVTIALAVGLALIGITSCESEGKTAFGDLVLEVRMSGIDQVARAVTPLDRFFSLFTPRAAYALPDLGFDSNSYPYNQFEGEMPAQGGLSVLVTASDSTFIAQGVADTSGIITFTNIDAGYLTVVLTGADGNNYYVPVQVTEETRSRTRVVVYHDQASAAIRLISKTIHDSNSDGLNDDDFSYAVYSRPWNSAVGGVVHLHLDGETRIDKNGDGDFLDSDDRIVIEPDDDGIASDDGDNDEDNDGIVDINDDDIDGDGTENASDSDMDGDGIADVDDDYPRGITPDDDFEPPTLTDGEPYTGVADLALISEDTVTVYFPPAVDDKHEPVTYLIYYSTTSPVDPDTAYRKAFRPAEGSLTGDDLLTKNISVPTTGLTYYFAVHVIDSAQPPNMDTNEEEMEIEVP